MPDWIPPLLSVLFGGGLLTAFTAWRRDVKRGPIEAQTAQVADAVALSNAASGMVEKILAMQHAQDVRLSAREAAQDAKLAAQDAKIESLQTRVYRWGDWYVDLGARWPHHRLQETPPPPPD